MEIEYDSFRIPVELSSYRETRLSDGDVAAARTSAQEAPASSTGDATVYFLQNALIERIAAESTLHVPKPLAHERALSMARSLQGRLEADGLTIEGYLDAMKLTKEELVKQFEQDATHQLRERIVLLAIARAEGIEASDDDYAHEVERLGSLYGIDPAGLTSFFSAGEEHDVRRDISIAHAADLIRSLALEYA